MIQVFTRFSELDFFSTLYRSVFDFDNSIYKCKKKIQKIARTYIVYFHFKKVLYKDVIF